MKKFIVIALALFLAIPAISFAGSATSRWDMTIGGYVKFDMGYSWQAQSGDYLVAAREGFGPAENFADEFGNFFSAAGETRLNFLVKGPDGWGAKTMAFIEGDFRGNTNSGYGAFSLRHAFMRMQWANDTLTIGHTWQKWGLLPTFANTLLAFNMLAPFLKGTRQPQIMWDHTWNKNFTTSLGIISPSQTLGGAGGSIGVDRFSLSGLPFLEGEVAFTSDACGKIGPWQMLFSLSGFVGQAKETFVTSAITGAALTFGDETVDAWGAAFKGFIPIIPEKKGDKAGALGVAGIIFATQNPSWYQPGPFVVAGFNRRTANGAAGPNADFSNTRQYGGWAQISYWFTDKFYINGWYGQVKNSLSDRMQFVSSANNVRRQYEYIANLSYDVNPAMRLGLEWDYIYTKFARVGAPSTTQGIGDTSGKMNAVRIGAWYFF